MRLYTYLNENKMRIQEVENLIQNKIKIPYGKREEIKSPLGFVFRITSEKEFKNIMSGYFSGGFWSSDPLEYLEYMTNGSYLLIAKPEGPKKYRGKEKEHYHNLEKKELEEITSIYSIKGNGTSRKLIKIYP